MSDAKQRLEARLDAQQRVELLETVFAWAVKCRRRCYSIRSRFERADREFFDGFNQAIDGAIVKLDGLSAVRTIGNVDGELRAAYLTGREVDALRWLIGDMRSELETAGDHWPPHQVWNACLEALEKIAGGAS